MPNQPPLNPDANADVARMRDMVVEAIDNPGESVHEFVSLPDLYQLLDHLTVAQPVVNSVEELDALPFNTVAMFTMRPLDRPIPFELSSINGEDKTWQQPGDGAAYPNSIMARYLPAIVLHHPEVPGA